MRVLRHALIAGFACLLLQTAYAHQAMVDEDEVVAAGAFAADELSADQGEGQASAASSKASKASDADFAELDQLTAPKETKDFEYYFNKYPYEFACVNFFIGLIIVLFVGKGRTADTANEWHKIALPVLKENFACVGLADGKQNFELEHTSFSEFTFYASGRQNMFYALFKLDMIKRHCLFSVLVTDRLYSPGDCLTIDIPIRFPGDFKAKPSVPLEFFVCKKSAQKAVFTMHEHLSNFVVQVKADNLPVPSVPSSKKELKKYKQSDHLIVLAESEEAANSIIDSKIGEILLENGEVLLDVHITDQEVYNKYGMFMRARILIGDKEANEKAVKVLQAIFKMCDRVTKLQLSAANKKRAEQVRRKVDSDKNTDEKEQRELVAAAKKREADLKFNEKWKTLSREDQMKLEEKKRAQDLKAQKKRMMKMVKR